jgi:hypothetical protein
MVVLWGPAARIAIIISGVVGFVLALGDVLDLYDALWPYTLPATAIYGALIWRFALATPKGEPPVSGGAPALVLMKLAMTIALILATLGLAGLALDIARLVAGNWPYIVLALVIVAAVCLWAVLAGRKERS